MEIHSRQGIRRFQLRITYGNSYYIERIAVLEKIFCRKPRGVHIDMVGVGEIPVGSALLIRSVLLGRSPKTRIVTNARSCLQGGSVMVLLLGDSRTIRDDARLYFRRANLTEDAEVEPNGDWKHDELKYRYSFSEIDLDKGDYARVLRQFGLVANEQVDCFLATAFGKSERALVPW